MNRRLFRSLIKSIKEAGKIKRQIDNPGEIKMIKRLICTVFGHTKPTTFFGIFQLYTKHKDTYFSEGKFHRCRRCHKLVYLGKGILTIEIVDIMETTLQNMPHKN